MAAAAAPSRLRLAVGAGAAAGAVAALLWWRRTRRRAGLRIARLCVYPVKSCRGLNLPEARLTPQGLAHDREFVVVEVVSEGKAVPVTLREVPQMALVAPEMPTSGELFVRKEGMQPLLVQTRVAGAVSYRVSSGIWDDPGGDGEDLGDEAAAWFSEALQKPNLRLLRFTGSRPTPEPSKYGEGYTTFSDGFPVLLTSEASLSELERRSGLEGMAERMRPNVVVAGCSAHEEDRWTEIQWARGEARASLRLPKPCARCNVPRVDPATGVVGPDPLRFLKRYHSGRQLLEGDTPHKDHYANNRGEIFFGQNVNLALAGDVVLRVGDPLLSVR